jgi:acetylornithine deacetylase/succinyl-diaminopimelate desuccinylase-like protein
MASLSVPAATAFVEKSWPSIQTTLEDCIRVPSQSPQFDPEHLTNGHAMKVVELLTAWVAEQKMEGLTLEVISDPGRTPLIFIEVAATGGAGGTVLLYGHLDKQPPMTEAWSEGLHPYVPVV